MTLSSILDQVYGPSDAGHGSSLPKPPVTVGRFDNTHRHRHDHLFKDIVTASAGTEGSVGQPQPTALNSRGGARLSTSMRVALTARDCHCRFPGCHIKHDLQAYQIDLHHSHSLVDELELTEHLVMLCAQHYNTVIDGSYKIVRGSDGAFTFMRCDPA